ncbi:MAG: hypothetical protein ACRELY_22005 [Polyangiaceae bacterium]
MAAGGNKFHREMQPFAMPEERQDAHKPVRYHDAPIPRPTESGVFVTSRRAIDLEEERPSVSALADDRALEEVTLIVYGWENVQPGALSWTFPSLRSALDAVRAMRNAVRWAVLIGDSQEQSGVRASAMDESGRAQGYALDESGRAQACALETAREQGRILVEA